MSSAPPGFAADTVLPSASAPVRPERGRFCAPGSAVSCCANPAEPHPISSNASAIQRVETRLVVSALSVNFTRPCCDCATEQVSARRLRATRHEKYCPRKRKPSAFGTCERYDVQPGGEPVHSLLAEEVIEASGPDCASLAGLPTKVDLPIYEITGRR